MKRKLNRFITYFILRIKNKHKYLPTFGRLRFKKAIRIYAKSIPRDEIIINQYIKYRK